MRSFGLEVGLGEISPLFGLHSEKLDQVKCEVELSHDSLRNAESENLPEFEAELILALDGKSLARCAGIDRFLPSVRSGLEMALISLASQNGSFT